MFLTAWMSPCFNCGARWGFYTAERRAVERDRDRVSATLRAPVRPSSVRRWLGTALIAVGSRIAGSMPMPHLDTGIAYRQVGA
ncbi:MAG: hypothetical protein H0T93_08110 [Chloroflexia bacterium]|jgi:hypothetical protein|nr:hypothetical protein [Chloroflexia bacterium]